MPDPVYDPRDSNLRIGTNTSYTRQLVRDEPRRTNKRTNKRTDGRRTDKLDTLHDGSISSRQMDKLEQNAEFLLLSLPNWENDNKVPLWWFIYNYERYEMQPEILNDHSSLVQTSVVDKLQFTSCSSNHGSSQQLTSFDKTWYRLKYWTVARQSQAAEIRIRTFSHFGAHQIYIHHCKSIKVKITAHSFYSYFTFRKTQ